MVRGRECAVTAGKLEKIRKNKVKYEFSLLFFEIFSSTGGLRNKMRGIFDFISSTLIWSRINKNKETLL